MKQLLSRLLLGLLCAGFLTASGYGQVRVATIDLSKVFDGYWKTKQAQGILKERQADMEKEMKSMMEDQKQAKEAYDRLIVDANDPAVSSEERDKRKRAAEEKLKYLRDQNDVILQYDRQAKATIEEQMRRLREAILTEIRAIVNARAKSSAYTMVIDSAAESINRTPVLLYHNGENDLTQDVLKELNATNPEGEAKSEGTAGKPSESKKK